MSVFSYLRRLRRLAKPAAKSRPVRARLGLEMLEDRLVPSAVSIDPTTRVLTYQADSSETNSLQISHVVTPKADRYVFTETGGIGIRDGSGGTFTTVKFDSATFDSIDVKVDDQPDSVTVLSSDKLINIYGGKGNDSFTVRATSQPINIHGEDGNDKATIGVTVAAGTRGMEDITAPVTFDGGQQGANGKDQLILTDRAPAVSGTQVVYTVDGAAVTRERQDASGNSLSQVQVSGTNVERLQLDGTNQNDIYIVHSTQAGTPVEIHAGGGDDRFRVGNMDLLADKLTLHGQGGVNNVLTINDLATSDRDYALTSTSVVEGTATIAVDTLQGLTIIPPTANNNTYEVQSMTASMPLTLNGGTGNTTVTINDSAASANTTYTLDAGKVVRALTSSVVTGTVYYGAINNLIVKAGKGADTFQMTDTAQPGTELDGGKGNDTIDYSTFKKNSDVLVNLATGKATNVDTLSNVENAYGGHGDDILVGNGNANLLKGNGGNDVMIGEGGADVIRGGAGEDLMIDGSTAYDTGTSSTTFLASIRNAWADTTTAVGDRVNNIKTGVGILNSIKLDSTTVTNDTDRDQLFGNDGKTPATDWFWANSTQDKMTSLTGEIFE
jgi:hypothetical protein